MDSRNIIEALVQEVTPFDELERQHQEETLTWVQSGVPLFRIQKPDIPPKHLVSYIVVFDEEAQKILLVDHKKAQLWVPASGHVDEGEHPQETARRECLEELGIEAVFWHPQPVFLTSTVTVGLTAGHTDVSFWYVICGNHQQNYLFDRGEFNAVRWFGFDDIPFTKADPYLKRFIAKLQGLL